MDTVPDAWDFASLVCKLLFYFGAASLVGGSACLVLYSDGSRRTVMAVLRYMLLGAFLGFQGVLINFFLQVGIVNGQGMAGMFDWSMAQLLLDTQIGDATFFRLAGFALALVVALVAMQQIAGFNKPAPQSFYRMLLSFSLLAFLLLVMGFRFTGHVSVLSALAKLAIACHVLAVSAWLGSLWPLYRLTHLPDSAQLQPIMARFGRHAVGVLLLLVVAGLLLSLELFATPGELVATPYGLAFLLKLTLVAAILGVAAVNKFRLTPALTRGSALPLRRSIQLEALLALAILLITAYFSTVVGPAEH